MMSDKPLRILTIDVEEWFHILDHDSTRTENEWPAFESRIHRNIERVLLILGSHRQQATFFCMGWIAEKYPAVIREIHSRGYEIGSHSHLHQLAYEQSPERFRQDLEKSVKTLEDITGAKVRYYRAPGFSIGEDNKWAFEILAGAGIEADCSVFPAPRAHGGFPAYGTPVPSVIRYSGIILKELPVSYITLLGKPVIFSGGGYFRLFPYFMIKNWTLHSDYIMTYFHPRDFDPDQPVIKDLPLTRKFKSYVGLKDAEKKLRRWLQDFEFTDVKGAIGEIDWSQVPIVEI